MYPYQRAGLGRGRVVKVGADGAPAEFRRPGRGLVDGTPPGLTQGTGTAPVRQPTGYGELPTYSPTEGTGELTGSVYGTGERGLIGGAPGPTQDYGTAPVRQPPGYGGLPTYDAAGQGQGDLVYSGTMDQGLIGGTPGPTQDPPGGGAPMRQPPGYGAFGAMPPQSQGGDHARFIESLPDRQRNQVRQLMSNGMPFDQAYRMSMQRGEAF